MATLDIEPDSAALDNEKLHVFDTNDSPSQQNLGSESPMSASDDRSSCSATIDTEATGQTMTSESRRKIDDLFENLLNHEIVDQVESDSESTESDDGESTTMSTILPDDGPCHLYMPSMGVIPEKCSKQGSPNSQNSNERNNRTNVRQRRIVSDEEKIDGCQGGNDSELFARGTDDRPEEVYVETFSNNSANGSKSEYSSSTSRRYRTTGSITRRSGVYGDSSVQGSSANASKGGSNILESMGLGSWKEGGGKGENEISTPSLDALLGNTSGDMTDCGRMSVQQERKTRAPLRAGMIMIILMSVFFFVVQLSAVAQHDKYDRYSSRNRDFAYDSTLRSLYKKGNSGSIRGQQKIPRTLHEFANPVHASNTADVSNSNTNPKDRLESQRKTMVMEEDTSNAIKSDKNENIVSNPMTKVADDLNKTNVNENAGTTHTPDAAIQKTIATNDGINQNQPDVGGSTTNAIPNISKSEQEISKPLVYGPVDPLIKISEKKSGNGGQLQVEEVGIASKQISDVAAAGSTNNLPLNGYENLSDIRVSDVGHADTPFFWSIPQTGGEKIKEVLKTCMMTVIASEVGGLADEQNVLRTFKINGRDFVNVDVSTAAGIEHAKSLGMVQSGMPGVIISPLFHNIINLFDSSHHGRAFTLLRHPVERAISTYHDRKRANDPIVNKMTLAQYAVSPQIENNWMVRYLTGKVQGAINEDDLALAKEILRRKFIIGLDDRLEESMDRLKKYFVFQSNPTVLPTCTDDILKRKSLYTDFAVKDGTPTWSLIEWQNRLDIELYIYAQELYESQGQQYSNLISAS